MLEGLQDHLRAGAEPGDVIPGAETEASAHRWERGVTRTGVVRARPYVAVRAVRREADRVRDASGEDLIRSEEQRQHWQSRRVGRRPPVRPHRVRAEVPDRARAGPRRLAVGEGLEVVDLVER